MREHDISYKLLFEEKEVFLDLLRCFMDESAVDHISIQELRKLPAGHIQESRDLPNDGLTWMTKDGTFLFVIEFQDSFDNEMDSRMRIHVENVRRARDECTGNSNVPYIAPMVISDIGDSKKFEAISRCYRMPGLFSQESEELFLYAGKAYSSLDMIDFRPPFPVENNLVRRIHELELFRKEITDTGMFLETMRKLAKRIQPDNPSLNEAFLGWIKSSLFPESGIRKRLENCETIKEALAMLENTMSVWEQEIARKNFDESLAEGESKTSINAVILSIQSRFNLESVPENIRKMAVSALGRIGLGKSLDLVIKSPTLKDYENQISGKHEAKGRQAPRQ